MVELDADQCAPAITLSQAELHALTGEGKMVFRGERHHERPMSENTVNAALRAMGAIK